MGSMRHDFESLGLKLVCYEWGKKSDDRPTIILLHGFLDQALSFDLLAESLEDEFHVLAPDLRGHGQSGHIGVGGYYHFPDYVHDLDRLFEHFGLSQASLVGHSMGAALACYFSGTYPEKVPLLALLDGIGPKAKEPLLAPKLMRRWLNDLKLLPFRERRVMTSLEEVAQKLSRTSPSASKERLLELAESATAEEIDGFEWLFDPLHRTSAPMPFDVLRFKAFLKEISAQVLLLWGEHSPMKPPDYEDRKACLQHAEEGLIQGAHHNLHHENPKELELQLKNFFSRHRGLMG